MTSSSSRSLPTATADRLIAAGIAVAALAAVVVVVVSGHSSTEVLAVIAGPAVSGMTAALLARRQSAIAQTTNEIATQTNGQLTGRLDELPQRTAAAVADLQVQATPSP